MKAYRFLLIAAIAVAAATGCHKQDRPQRQNGGEGNGNGQQQDGGREQTVFTLRENTTWRIEYGGRKIQDGAKVEEITVENVPANTMYLVSVINKENLSTYEASYKDFFEAELAGDSGNYVYSGPQTVYYDPFLHGTWYAFIIAIDSDKNLTGEYAYKKFVVDEEEPTDGFLKWIGNWTATDGEITYNLKVSSLEANFMYRVDGWEVFDDAIEQMNQEYLTTFYDNGDMYFTSQFIGVHDMNYTDDNGKTSTISVEECFLGEIYYDDIQEGVAIDWYIITEENIDLACAELKEDDSAVIKPCSIIAEMGGKDYETVFYDMKYFFWNEKTGWKHYNDPYVLGHETMLFPVNMTRATEDTAVAAIGRRGITQDTPAKALRGKVYKPKTQRAKAVKSR